MSGPVGITLGPWDGNLYVTSYVTNQVYKIQRNSFPAGSPTVFVDAPAGGLNGPYGLVFGPDYNLYVASYTNSLVQKYNGMSGDLIITFVNNTPTGFGPTFLAIR